MKPSLLDTLANEGEHPTEYAEPCPLVSADADYRREHAAEMRRVREAINARIGAPPEPPRGPITLRDVWRAARQMVRTEKRLVAGDPTDRELDERREQQRRIAERLMREETPDA